MWHEWQCVKCAVRASCAQNNVCATKSMYIIDTCLIVGLLLPLIIFFSLLHRLKKKKTALHIDKNLRLWSRNLDLTTVQHAGHVFGVCEMTRRSTPERSEGANSVSEAVGDEKKEQMGSKEHSAMTWPVAKWLMDAQTNRQPLSQTCNHTWRAQAYATRKCACAYGEVLSVHFPSRSWQLLLSGHETARKN